MVIRGKHDLCTLDAPQTCWRCSSQQPELHWRPPNPQPEPWPLTPPPPQLPAPTLQPRPQQSLVNSEIQQGNSEMFVSVTFSVFKSETLWKQYESRMNTLIWWRRFKQTDWTCSSTLMLRHASDPVDVHPVCAFSAQCWFLSPHLHRSMVG